MLPRFYPKDKEEQPPKPNLGNTLQLAQENMERRLSESGINALLSPNRLSFQFTSSDESESPPSSVTSDQEQASTNTSLSNEDGPGEWMQEEVQALPIILTSLVQAKFSTAEIGMYSETILYERDTIFSGLVTNLVNANATYVEIGRAVMNHVNLRIDDSSPVCKDVEVSDMSERPRWVPEDEKDDEIDQDLFANFSGFTAHGVKEQDEADGIAPHRLSTIMEED